MKANQNLTIEGHKSILVPYRREHVLPYHAWMASPALQEATASEPLTLEEEYEMQQSWCEDEQKCTFIILDKARPDTPGCGNHGGGMAGDVNLFWNDHDDPNAAEIEVMVAEEGSRRHGLAREALGMFMAYAADKLGVQTFRAKIGEANVASLSLFRTLGYRHVSRSEYFKEATMEVRACDLQPLSFAPGYGTYSSDL
ncbi:hypothetical protein ACKKBG_A09105 [Auxenochlorella protothecoides x Auxenochlorella symbiontica]